LKWEEVYLIGASNDLVAQAYALFILSPSIVTDTPYSNITKFYDGSREITYDGAEKASMNGFVCVWLNFSPHTHFDDDGV
jgi:hypothetical protein